MDPIEPIQRLVVPEATKKNKSLYIGLITLLLVVLGLAGFMWSRKGCIICHYPGPENTAITNTKNADWVTYRNNQYGFEIKYPAKLHNKTVDWQAYPEYSPLLYLESTSIPLELSDTVPEGVNGTDFSTQGYYIIIRAVNKSWKNGFFKDDPSAFTKLEFSNINALKDNRKSSEKRESLDDYRIYIENPKSLTDDILLTYLYNCRNSSCSSVEVSRTVNQILSTFKLIK